MQSYLVGGAVRDRLLGLPVTERDFVVVGSTDVEMINAGFRTVGSFFPVYLHPDTNEEYALARTERKNGPGHTGFECSFEPTVTLEEDLQRRDLTVNAIAEKDNNELVDPYGGVKDLEARQLRHVSIAFGEDPLRILRIARFKAKLHHLGFTIHPETKVMLEAMVTNGALKELTHERILGELDKALLTASPAEFFQSLETIGANTLLWPEISLEAVVELGRSKILEPEIRFALLLRTQSVELINELCTRLKCSNRRRDNATLVAQYLAQWQNVKQLDAKQIVDFVIGMDGLRKQDRFSLFSETCEAISGEPLADYWNKIVMAMSEINARDLGSTATGKELGEVVRRARVEHITTLID